MPATGYKPDNLASGGAAEKPFSPAGGKPAAIGGGIVGSLLRLARLRSYGYGATKNTMPTSQPMALTAGSHGKTK